MNSIFPLFCLVLFNYGLQLNAGFAPQPHSPIYDYHINKIIIIRKNDFGNKISHLRDSAIHVQIDTLIMENGAKLNISGKKQVIFTIKHASIGKNCKISLSNGKNQGTDITFNVCFSNLGSLTIDASGKNFKDGNHNFPIGNGGNISVNYLKSCLAPQTENRRLPHYLETQNSGGKGSLNPQSDLYVVHAQIASGRAVPGRPLSGLSQGTVYQGSDGASGKTKITSVEHF